MPRNQATGSGLLVSHVFESAPHRLDDLRPIEALAAAVPLLMNPTSGVPVSVIASPCYLCAQTQYLVFLSASIPIC